MFLTLYLIDHLLTYLLLSSYHVTNGSINSPHRFILPYNQCCTKTYVRSGNELVILCAASADLDDYYELSFIREVVENSQRTEIDKFGYGFLFALVMASVRFIRTN